MELYQAEWCPHSQKVRQRLTELGLDRYEEREDADAHREKARKEVPTFAEVG
jgi:glutaredoxin